jgi:hypothetical protein
MTNQILSSTLIGLSAVLDKQTEDHYRRGVNLTYSAISQISSVDNAITQLSLALIASTGSDRIPASLKFCCYLTPIVMALASTHLSPRSNKKLRAILMPVHKYTGTMAHWVILISSLALIRFGQPISGGIPMVFILYGFAQRKNLISNRVHQVVKNLGFLVVNGLRLTNGNTMQQAYALFYISIEVNTWYARRKNQMLLNTEFKKEPLVFEKFKSLIEDRFQDFRLPSRLDLYPFVDTRAGNLLLPRRYNLDSLHLEINTNKVFKNLVPPPISQSLDELKSLFKRLKLKIDERIRDYVKQDEHWAMFYCDKSSDQDIYTYLETGITNLVDTINNRGERSGEFQFTSLIDLKSRLSHIIKALKKREKSLQIATIIQLALASYYCPIAYNVVIERYYDTLCNYLGEDTAPGKLAQILQYDRLSSFQGFFNSTQENLNWYQRILTPKNETHSYHYFANLLSDDFLLPLSHSLEDSLASPIPLEKPIYRWCYKTDIDKFKMKYTLEYVFALTQKAITEGTLGNSLVESWFAHDFFGKMDDNSIIKIREVIYDDRNILKPIYVLYFLVKEGFFILSQS